MRACPRQTLHPPSGGNAAPRLFDRITVADAPKRDQGLSTDVTKTREPSRSWRAHGQQSRHPTDRAAGSDDRRSGRSWRAAVIVGDVGW